MGSFATKPLNQNDAPKLEDETDAPIAAATDGQQPLGNGTEPKTGSTKLNDRTAVAVTAILQNAAIKSKNMSRWDRFLAFFHGVWGKLTGEFIFENRKNHLALEQAANKAKMKLSEVITEAPKHLAKIPVGDFESFLNALGEDEKYKFLQTAENQIRDNLNNFQSVCTPSEGFEETNSPLGLARTFANNAQALFGSTNLIALGDRIDKFQELVKSKALDAHGDSLTVEQLGKLAKLVVSNDRVFNNLAFVLRKCVEKGVFLNSDQLGKLIDLAVDGDRNGREALNDLEFVLLWRVGKGIFPNPDQLGKLIDLAVSDDQSGRKALESLANVIRQYHGQKEPVPDPTQLINLIANLEREKLTSLGKSLDTWQKESSGRLPPFDELHQMVLDLTTTST